MSEKKNYPLEFGGIYENKNGETGETFLSISISKDVTLKKGMRVKLEKPQAKFDRILNSPKSSEEFKQQTREEQARLNPALKMRLVVQLDQ